MNNNWSKSITEIDTTVTNPDGANTKDLAIGEVEVLARDVKGCTKSLILEKALYLPRYGTSLISVSNTTDNGHKVVHEKKNRCLCLKSKEKFSITTKGKLFLCSLPQKKNTTMLTCVGGQLKPSSCTNAWAT